jgi:peptide/nickel transport system permease protein
LLLLYAAVVSLLIGVPLAVMSAVKRNRPADHIVRVVLTAFFSLPAFLVGLLLALLFGLRLNWLPVSGYVTRFPDNLRYLTLPAITLGLFLAPLVTRTLRGALVSALASDYVEAARARGFRERRVTGIHAMRNSLIATITVVTVHLGYLLGGSVIVENVFQIPGLGSLMTTAILGRDYVLIQFMTLLFGVVVIGMNLLADVAYVVVDPRVALNA